MNTTVNLSSKKFKHQSLFYSLITQNGTQLLEFRLSLPKLIKYLLNTETFGLNVFSRPRCQSVTQFYSRKKSATAN